MADDAGGGAMFQRNIRIAGLFIVGAAMAATGAAHAQKPGGGHGGGPAVAAPHAAAAPRAAPAPHIAAPRHAPAQAAAPRHAQAPRAAPQQAARPPSRPGASAMARHAPTPRSSVAPREQQRAGAQAGPNVTQPSPRGNLARQ